MVAEEAETGRRCGLLTTGIAQNFPGTVLTTATQHREDDQWHSPRSKTLAETRFVRDLDNDQPFNQSGRLRGGVQNGKPPFVIN